MEKREKESGSDRKSESCHYITFEVGMLNIWTNKRPGFNHNNIQKNPVWIPWNMNKFVEVTFYWVIVPEHGQCVPFWKSEIVSFANRLSSDLDRVCWHIHRPYLVSLYFAFMIYCRNEKIVLTCKASTWRSSYSFLYHSPNFGPILMKQSE